MTGGSDPRGFSLIELLVALLIATTSVLGFAAGTLSVMRANRESERMSAATALGQKRLAELAAAAASPAPLPAPGSRTDGAFTVAWSYSTAGVPAGMTAVTATVTWTDGTQRTIPLQTIVEDL